MITAFATIAFLAAAWLAIVSIAGSLEDSFGKVGAALRGQSGLVPSPIAFRVSQRYPQSRQRVRARPALRAAA
jgi:hypothetical protein